MATREQIKELNERKDSLTTRERQNRTFSEDLKRRIVLELDKGLVKMSEVCREYQVRGNTVYKWIYKYSMTRKKGVRMVVEAESDTIKLKQLREQLREYEQLIGQKQIKIEFLEKLIELAGDEMGQDLKKKYGSRPSNGSGSNASSTPTA